METGVARMRRRDEDEPCGVGWRARRDQSNVRVSQAVAGEGKGRHFCIYSLLAFPHRAGATGWGFQPMFPCSLHI